MLTEDVVVRLLCDYLVTDGWDIVSRAMPDQRGTDVVATRAGVRMEVEAKVRAVRSRTQRSMANHSIRPR